MKNSIVFMGLLALSVLAANKATAQYRSNGYGQMPQCRPQVFRPARGYAGHTVVIVNSTVSQYPPQVYNGGYPAVNPAYVDPGVVYTQSYYQRVPNVVPAYYDPGYVAYPQPQYYNSRPRISIQGAIPLGNGGMVNAGYSY